MAVLRKRGKNWSIVESFRGDDGAVKKRFHATGVGCRRAAEALLKRFHENKERGIAGTLDPRQAALDRPAAAWLGDYVLDLKARGTSDHYAHEVNRVLSLVLAHSKAGAAREFTPAAVRAYLAASGKSPATRNQHRAYCGGFFNFLTGDGKPFEVCPFTKHSVPPALANERKAARRPYRVSELAKLLDAAGRYPLESRLTGQGGRPRADGTPAVRSKPANLSPATRAALELSGRERRLIYRVALFTGLRRGELSRLKVSDARLTGKRPRITTSKTKNRRRAVIPLSPSLAADLSAFIADAGRAPGDKLLNVPAARNLSRLHKSHMKYAGLPYRNSAGVPATFHSLRRTAKRRLRRAGVPDHDAARFLRHAARGVTEKHYGDGASSSMSPRVFKVMTRLDAKLHPAGPATDCGNGTTLGGV